MVLGKRLQELRKSHGMPMSEVAEKLQVCYTAVSQHEHSRRVPKWNTLASYAGVYDTSIGYILGTTEDKSPITYDVDIFNLKNCGKRLRELRINSGLTKAQFGDLFGYSADHIHNLECGASKITVDFCQRLAKHYGVSAEYILGLIDKKEI